MSEEVTFLKLLIRKGIIAEDEAKSYLRAYQLVKQHGRSRSISDWLVKRRILSPEQCQMLERQLKRVSQGHKVLPVDSEGDPRAPKKAKSSRRSGRSKRPGSISSRRTRNTRFGDYAIKREIARGGMGAVYEAYHPEYGGPLALKVLLARGRSNPRQRKRFEREIETIQRMDHEGLITVIDAGTTDGIDYMTMEFIDGKAMDEVLAERELDRKQLIKAIRDMALALDHAHQFGVIHRDLKPANVLIRSSTKAPVITDFGLAKDLLDSEVLSRTGTVIGTPRYLSPEQVMALHDDIGPTTDIYALGVILYEGLTGARPFDADSIESLYQKIEDDPPIHPCSVDPDIPEDLADICLKAMSKDQLDRYQSGEDMARDLDTWLKKGRVEVFEKSWKSRLEQRYRELYARSTRLVPASVLAVMLAGVIILLLSVIAYLLFGSSETPLEIPK